MLAACNIGSNPQLVPLFEEVTFVANVFRVSCRTYSSKAFFIIVPSGAVRVIP